MSTAPSVSGHAIVRGLFAGPIRPLRSARAPGGEVTPWRSAILKASRTSATVGLLGLHGDAQKERKHHGGPLKAVLVYGAAHYERWDESLAPHAALHAGALRAMSGDVDASAYGFGAFGENVTVDALTERTVCIGDLWQIGSCVLRVTEPRGPCATLTRRWMRPELLGEVKATAAAGWYNAVEQEGAVSVGDDMTLLDRVQDEWTIERVFHLIEARTASRAELQALHDHPVVHAELRARLTRRLAARR